MQYIPLLFFLTKMRVIHSWKRFIPASHICLWFFSRFSFFLFCRNIPMRQDASGVESLMATAGEPFQVSERHRTENDDQKQVVLYKKKKKKRQVMGFKGCTKHSMSLWLVGWLVVVFGLPKACIVMITPLKSTNVARKKMKKKNHDSGCHDAPLIHSPLCMVFLSHPPIIPSITQQGRTQKEKKKNREKSTPS